MTTPKTKCDCLNECGDDPALEKGTAEPCVQRKKYLQLQAAKNDTCYNCTHFEMCLLRHHMQRAINHSIALMNVVGDERPGHMNDIYSSVARACMEYKRGDT